MKVVINKCYGGFGLSPFGVKEYLKRQGKKAYFYKHTKYSFQKGGVDEYVRVDKPTKKDWTLSCYTEDHGKIFKRKPKDADNGYFYYGGIERTDPDLVAVLEEFGSEKVSGQLSKLKVVEIPDGVEWGMDEYDGIESIHEVHQSWG